MFGRLCSKADFERLLSLRPCMRSVHFAIHHVALGPTMGPEASNEGKARKLCTEDAPAKLESVDNLGDTHLLGFVLPKRHAKRSVTRNLLRRQIRSAMLNHQRQLPHGLWLVRLRSPFPRDQFVSASSNALRLAASQELAHMLSAVRA